MNRHILIFITAAMVAVVLAGCHSSRSAVEYDSIYDSRPGGGKARPGHKRPGRNDNRVPHVASGTAADVIRAAEEWLGVPYKYSGNSRAGTDCSGLTCMAYEKGAGLKLPRSSREQADFSRRIKRNDLRPGDLVFFVSRRGGSRINHVAIYIGDNKIIHATSSRGVSVSDLDDKYWSSHYYCCGRVL